MEKKIVVCDFCGKDQREKGARWKFIHEFVKGEGCVKRLFCDRNCKFSFKKKKANDFAKKENDFINSYLAERKAENSCESAVRAFFTMRKIIKRKVGIYQEDNITLFRMIELLKNGNIFYQDHTTNVNIDLKKFYQPWIIELISKTNCEHQWCKIIRSKINNQDD